MSTLRVNNITDASGGSSSLSVPGAAKAWVNFNGTGTVTIRAALNVTSITDNGVGNFTLNFTTALSDADYAWSGSGSSDTNSTAGVYVGFGPTATYPITKTATALRVVCQTDAGTAFDPSQSSVIVHR